MERMIGIILIVLAAWIGVEFFMEGSGAFGGILNGGIFSSADSSDAPAEETWAGERAGRKLEGAHADRDAKMKHALGE